MSTDPFGYAAQYGAVTDRGTGLVLMGYRYYDPASSRFLTRDPIGYAGGMNLYGYADGDPVNGTDPLGLRTQINDARNGPLFYLITADQRHLRRTAKGRALLDTLVRRPTMYTFDQAIPGRGSSYDPSTHTIYIDYAAPMYYDTTCGIQKAPTWVRLAHEVGHAATNLPDTSNPIHQGPNVSRNENAVRAQAGLPLRTTYYGYTAEQARALSRAFNRYLIPRH